MKTKTSLIHWLFKPFTFIAGTKALVWGIVIMGVLSVLGYLFNVHFDGAIDIHYGSSSRSSANYWVHLFYQLVGWLSMVIVFYPAALIYSKSRVRLVDMAGTLAFAKFPLLLAALWGGFSFSHLPLDDVFSMTVEEVTGVLLQNLPVMIINILVVLLPAIWMIVTTYNAFSVSSNLKDNKGVQIYAVALLLAEVLSKVALYYLMPYLSFK